MNLRERSFAYFAQVLGYFSQEQIQACRQGNSLESYLEKKPQFHPQLFCLRFLFLKQYLLLSAREAGYLTLDQCKILLVNKINAIRQNENFLRLGSLDSGLVPMPFFLKMLARLEQKGISGREERKMLVSILSSLDDKRESEAGIFDNTDDKTLVAPKKTLQKDMEQMDTIVAPAGVEMENLAGSPDLENYADNIDTENTLPQLALKDKLGSYEIVQKIGAGGMGKVYQAYHARLDRMVAIKVLMHGRGTGQEEEQERFLTEARLTARLQHPNIVTIHDVGSEKGLNYIVMDFIEGKSLDWCIEHESFSIRRTLKIAKDILLAIEYAHENGIIHRDLKPANIIIEKNTGRGLVVDFGLAKNIHLSTKTSQKGKMIGTPRYMSPEQISGEEEKISPCTDIYAMGAILYEMLTGVEAVQSETSWGIIYKIINESVPSLRKYNPNVSIELERICSKAMEKLPLSRYQSAKAFSRDIDRFLESRKKRRGEKPRKSRNYRTAVFFLLPLALLAITATIYLMQKPSRKKISKKQINHAESKEAKQAKELWAKNECLWKHISAAQQPIYFCPRYFQDAYLNNCVREALLQKRQDRMLADLSQCINGDPSNAVAYFNRGAIYLAKKNVQGAFSDFCQALKLKPAWAEAYYNRGVSLAYQGIHDRAFVEFSKAAKLKPDWAEAHFNRGLARFMQDCDGAIIDFTRAIEIRPAWARAYVIRGSLYLDKNDMDRALMDFNQSIALDPNQPASYFNRGYVKFVQKDLSGALTDFERAVTIDPRWDFAYLNRGVAYTHAGEWQKALADFDQTLSLKPKWALALEYRGVVQFRLGEYDKAIADFTKILSLNPNAAPAYFDRAITQVARGEMNKAARDFEKASTFTPRLKPVIAEIMRQCSKERK